MSELTFEDIALEVTPALARYLRRQVADQAAAEDLLQETLIRIARGLPGFDGRSSLKTWCYSIAARVAIDHFRRASGLPGSTELSEAESLPDQGHGPEQIVALDQMNACVRRVIDALPEEYRDAILMHHYKGLSAREAATACGCTEANAKVRIHRGRAKLKIALEQQCDLYLDEDNVLRCVPKEGTR